jgi:hypothetical protein
VARDGLQTAVHDQARDREMWMSNIGSTRAASSRSQIVMKMGHDKAEWTEKGTNRGSVTQPVC